MKSPFGAEDGASDREQSREVIAEGSMLLIGEADDFYVSPDAYGELAHKPLWGNALGESRVLMSKVLDGEAEEPDEFEPGISS